MSPRLLYVLLILLSSWFTMHGQDGLSDTSQLRKYSYLLYGHASSGNSVQATGFFVGNENRVYLVTACHVVNGWLFESYKKKGAYPDTLFVKVGMKASMRDTILPIDIRTLKQTQTDADSPDIYFIPVSIPPDCEIYRLDSLIQNYIPISNIPQAVLAYGYTSDWPELKQEEFCRLAPRKSVAFVPDWDTYACSPLAYEIGYANDELGPGDSGAPVYFLTGNINDNHHLGIRFGGLIFGGNSAKHRAAVIRPEIVKALLNDL